MDGDVTTLLTNTDPSLAYLSYIWGTGLFAGGSASSTMLSTAVGSLTTVVLAVAALFFMYQLVAGTVQSAHHGEVLGKEWSSLWVPVRFTLAGAALLPVGPGGAIGLQMAIAFMVKLALNAAGYIAITAMSALAAGQPLSAPPMPSVDSMAEQVWSLVTCAEGVNSIGTTLGGSTNGAAVSSLQVDSAAGAFGLASDVVTLGGSYSQNFCPTIIIGQIQPTAAFGTSISYGQFAQARVAAVSNLISSLQPIAHDLAAAARPCPSDSNGSCGALNFTVMDVYNAIQTAQNSYETDISGAFKGAQGLTRQGLGDLKDQAMNGSGQNTTGAGINYSNPASCGFVCLGAFYNQIAAINGNLVSAITAQPKLLPGLSQSASGYDANDAGVPDQSYAQSQGFYSEQAAYLAAAKDMFSFRDDPSKFSWRPALPIIGNYKPASGSVPEGASGGLWAQAKDKISNLSITKVITKYMAEFVYAYSQIGPSMVTSSNPISSLSSVGASVETVAFTLDSVMTVVPTMFGGLMERARSMIGILEASGLFLSQILPMMPYIMWLLAVIAYFTFVTEALVSAPLWGFAHLKAGGEGVHGEAGNGYMMMLTLLFMPSLMVIGYIAGMALMSMGVEILNNTFPIASADGSTASSVSNVASDGVATGIGLLRSLKGASISFLVTTIAHILAKFLLYCLIVTAIVERSFKLITALPGAVLKWMGGSGDSWTAESGAGGDALRNKIASPLTRGKSGLL